jgi:GTPase Era involved in 16S rRNA processing
MSAEEKLEPYYQSGAGGSGSEVLNNNHRLQLRITFQHIDSVLTEVEQILADPERYSPFSRYTSDITPTQRRIAHDYVVRVRAAMIKIMNEQAIPFADPHCGTRWASLTALLAASISAEDLMPDRMRGYGDISLSGRNLLESIRTELNLALGNLQKYLEECANADLEQRIGKISEIGDEAAWVKELNRIITIHGLVEYRNALAMIVDKLETKTFEIGVFGRVSSGKSSLLNYLLQVNCLPVDVAPVTAIPARIGYGPDPQVRIEFADNPPLLIPFSDLWDFASEQGNRNNAKHVTRINIKLPSPKLSEGTIFVDTPGLGTLATSGSTETLTYLPRCDLGILMLEASVGVTAEDCAVLDALSRAGSNAVILISKCDLFNEKERAKLIAYVTDEIQKQLAISLPIFPVSVVGESAALCDHWLSEFLEPTLRAHQRLAASATRRRVVVLRNAITAALESRLARVRGSVTSRKPQQRMVVEDFREAEMLLERSLRGSSEMCREIEDKLEPIVRQTAEETVTGWLRDAQVIPSEILAAKVSQVLAEPISGMGRGYWRTRNLILRVLEGAEKSCPKGLSLDLPAALGMPPLDPTGLAKTLDLRKPVWLSVFTASVVKRQLQQQIRRQVSSDLSDFLGVYARQLRNWFREVIANLRTSFRCVAAIYRIELEREDTEPRSNEAQIAADLERLKSEQVDGADAEPIASNVENSSGDDL